WFDWDLLRKNADVHRFVKHLIEARQRRDLSREDPGLTLNQLLERGRIQWHGARLNQPDWGNHSRSLALTALSLKSRFMVHLMVNAYWEALSFELPPLPDTSPAGWQRWIDTSLDTPDDIWSLGEAPQVQERAYLVQPRSIVILILLRGL
ncbi:MAG TPA: glycogen debranching enzyme, partial [Terriglobia bacterium]|nr:glycogen debranching enzyme [Terriglobia bacterium]